MQLGFEKRKPRKAAIQTERNLRECPNAGIVNVPEAAEMGRLVQLGGLLL
jgi:hypothetical protein